MYVWLAGTTYQLQESNYRAANLHENSTALPDLFIGHGNELNPCICTDGLQTISLLAIGNGPCCLHAAQFGMWRSRVKKAGPNWKRGLTTHGINQSMCLFGRKFMQNYILAKSRDYRVNNFRQRNDCCPPRITSLSLENNNRHGIKYGQDNINNCFMDKQIIIFKF